MQEREVERVNNCLIRSFGLFDNDTFPFAHPFLSLLSISLLSFSSLIFRSSSRPFSFLSAFGR